jgi:hypothetical protein
MFKNLNMEDPELNSLSTEEYSQVWKPAIRFLNKEPNSKARKKITKQNIVNENFSPWFTGSQIMFSSPSTLYKVLSV